MARSLKETFPLRLLIGSDDCTFLLDSDFTASSVDPGGFESASFQIPKDMPQTLRGTPVRLDCGLAVAWEGRVSQIQRSLGARTQIQCEGMGARFKDTEASMVFVDRDLTRWQTPSNSRQIALTVANSSLGSSQVAGDVTNNLPALVQTISDSWNSPSVPSCEAWYDAGPLNLIASVYYNVKASGPVLATNDLIDLSSDDIATAFENTANLYSTSGNSGYFTPATAYRFAIAQKQATATPGGAQGARYLSSWRNMAVYGNHGLSLRGPDPGGLYPSDIAGWVIGQAPGLDPGVIDETDSTGFIMPHSVYYTPVGLDQMISDMAIAGGWHWGAWESLSPLTGDPTPRVDFRPRPHLGQFSAFCLRRDTTLCDIREDLSQQFNRAVVSFTTIAGFAGAAVVTMDNPILDQAGIAQRTLILSAGTMDDATAALYGAEALAFTFAQARVAGSVQVEQAIDIGGGLGPAWLLKPGIDRLRIGDLPSFDAWGAYNDVPLTRMELSGSSSGFQASLEVGSGANLVETLNARIASATALAAQGG